MRLNRYIAMCGASSRRGADVLIAAGRVTVNGEIVVTMGPEIDPERDEVRVDNRPLKLEERKVYIMLNKPVGYISACSDDRGRNTVLSLIEGVEERIFPVGRLDYDTEGLLLLTNDGDFAYKCTHPSGEVKKRYLAVTDGMLSDDAIRQLRRGVMLDGTLTSPAVVEIKRRTHEATEILITIHEGRNRQVRRMMEAVGSAVRYLRRVSEGNLELKGLKPGEWRYLTREEIENMTP